MKIKKSIIIPEHSNTMYEHHFKSIILHYFEPGKQIMNHYFKKKKILKYLSSLAVDQISNPRQIFWLKLDSGQRDSQV